MVPADDTLAMALAVMPARRQGVRVHRATHITEDAVATTAAAAAAAVVTRRQYWFSSFNANYLYDSNSTRTRLSN